MKNKALEPEQLCSLMCTAFAHGGVFQFQPTGVSMLPMLREKRDTVLLCDPAVRPPRKLDVVFYRSAGGRLFLHRIIGRDQAGFILCGDHQVHPEYGIRPEQILGVLTAFTRKGRQISADAPLYRCYARLWIISRPVRHLFSALGRRIKKKKGG